MNRKQLIESIQRKRSCLCIGLDSDPAKIPPHLHGFPDPVFEFNKQIIEATHDLAVAYKPNLAFYESNGTKGWETLHKTVGFLKKYRDSVMLIADAKRGDIGYTSRKYAAAFFGLPPDGLDFDAVTVAPYMGRDSVEPFLSFENKWVILLALTSNAGAGDFQLLETANGKMIFEKVLETSKTWGTPDNLMYVIGATKAAMLTRVRTIVPDAFLLIPGIGAQGGDLDEVLHHGMNRECGLLINSSRGIIYAGSDEDFAVEARRQTLILQQKMEKSLAENGVI